MNVGELFQPEMPPLGALDRARLFCKSDLFFFDQNLSPERYMEELVEDYGSEEIAQIEYQKDVAALEEYIRLPGYTLEELASWMSGGHVAIYRAEEDFRYLWEEIFQKEFPIKDIPQRELRSKLGTLRADICKSFGYVTYKIPHPTLEWVPYKAYPALPPLDTAREYEETYLREQIALCEKYLKGEPLEADGSFATEAEYQQARLELLHKLVETPRKERKAALEKKGAFPDWFLAEAAREEWIALPMLDDALNHTVAEGRDVIMNSFFPAEYVQWLKDTKQYERVIPKKKRSMPTREEVVAAIEYERGISTVKPSDEVLAWSARATEAEKDRIYSYWIADLEEGNKK